MAQFKKKKKKKTFVKQNSTLKHLDSNAIFLLIYCLCL